jgi:hypothetical protein
MMGHYRSEMVSQEDEDRRINSHEKQQKKRAAYIKRDIEKRGIERVLADILDDPTMYSIHTL